MTKTIKQLEETILQKDLEIYVLNKELQGAISLIKTLADGYGRVAEAMLQLVDISEKIDYGTNIVVLQFILQKVCTDIAEKTNKIKEDLLSGVAEKK